MLFPSFIALASAGVFSVTVFSSQQPPEAPLPFSRSVTAGGFIHVSGMLAGDGSAPFAADIRPQTRTTLERVNGVLGESGVSLHDAVAVTVYLKRAGDFAAMNEVYRAFVGDTPPTRTTIVANLMRDDALIEISVVAAERGTARRVLHPDGWLRSPNPYSYAIEAGDTVFLSGLVARNPADNTLAGGDVAAQTKTIMESARALLAAAGLGFEHVVSARLYVTDLTQFDPMNAAYRAYFPKDPPARATVGAALMQPSYLVEITFVASRARKEAIAGDGAPNPTLSAAIRAGSRLYLSGMLGVTPGTKGDAAAQTRETLRKLLAVVARAGFQDSDVVESLVYLTSRENFGAMNGAYREALSAPFPARATVETALVVPDGLVEIMMTAIRK
jgi:2-iminobutanoate/2-iminopropanoate deaminase